MWAMSASVALSAEANPRRSRQAAQTELPAKPAAPRSGADKRRLSGRSEPETFQASGADRAAGQAGISSERRRQAAPQRPQRTRDVPGKRRRPSCRPSRQLLGTAPTSVALAPATVAAAAGAGVGAPAHGLELLEAPAGADGDAGERGFCEVGRHVRLLAQALVEALKQGAAAGEDDAAVHDVGRELGRGLVERRLDRVDDLHHRLLECVPDLLAREDDGLRQARQHVASAHLGLHLFLERERRADFELDLLRGLLADQQLVLAFDVVDDRLVHLVAADTQALADDDAAE